MSSSEIAIEPRPFWRIDYRAVWRSRHLVFLLAHREFASKFKQTILGPLWFVLHPLLTALLFTGIFGAIIRIPNEGVPRTIFYLSGLLVWTYFSQSLLGVSECLAANAQLLAKVPLPRLLLPLSVIVWNFVPWALQFVSFAVIAAFYPRPTVNVLGSLVFVPLLMAQTAMLALGVGLLLSSITVKYRDIRQLLTFLTQAWLFATPILYPVSLLSPRLKVIIAFNPLTAITGEMRHILLGTAGPTLPEIGGSLAVTTLFLGLGLFAFGLIESTMADIL